MGRVQRYMVCAAALLVLLALSSACTSTVSRNVSAEGVPDEVVFPKMEQKDLRKKGIFPNEANLKKIRPGMDKQDIYYLIGPPHFREIFSAREWDYVFRFSQGQEERLCQYKIIFDTDRIARSFYWQPAECGAGYFQTEQGR